MGIDVAAGAPVIDVYARLSFAPNGETVKVDDQMEMGREEIERRGGVVGQVFPDNSRSAWKPNVVRPQWNALTQRLEAGASNGVWVYDVTRFSRKVLEGERLVQLATTGVRVWSHAGEYDLTTADGRRMFRESMVAAAAESDKISERVKRGKLRRARKGRHHGGARAFAMTGWAPKPAGWEPGDPRPMVIEEVVAAERAIVVECYQRLFGGEPLPAVVADLDRRGVRLSPRARVSALSLSRMLTRAALAGVLVHNGQVMGELVGVEPVVPQEEWERMCALLAGRRPGRPARETHVVSGSLHCGLCGVALVGMTRMRTVVSRRGSASGVPLLAEPGGGLLIDARAVEAAIDAAMRTRLGDPRRTAQLAAHLAKVGERRATIEAQILTLETSADELAGKTAAWGLARVDKAMAPLLARVQALRSQLAALDGPGPALHGAADAIQAWDEAMDRHDLPMIRAMIKRAFPHLAIAPQTGRNDHGPHRILRDGPRPAATSAGA